MQETTFRSLVALLLFIQIAILLWVSVLQSPASDEYGHLYAGIAYWRQGDTQVFNVNPPLVRGIAALPALFEPWPDLQWDSSPLSRPEFSGGRQLMSDRPEQFMRALRLGRILVSGFALLGTIAICFWGRKLFGEVAGVGAGVFWVFQPQVISHGALITNDIAVASMMIVSAYLLHRWYETPSLRRAMCCCGALAIATLCKFTALLIWPVFLVAACVRVRSWRDGFHCVLGIAFALFLIAVPYRFVGLGAPVGGLEWVSESFQGVDAKLGLEDGLPGHLPSPVPSQFLLGLDRQQFDFQVGLPSYARGVRSGHGWWWFYLYSMAVKLPTGTLLAILVAVFAALKARAVPGAGQLIALAVLIAVFEMTAWKSGFAQQHRYIFPAYPFLFLIMVYPLRGDGRKSISGKLVLIGLICTVIGTVASTPDFMGAFNLLSGGNSRSHYHLFNDATDWGQDRDRVVDWINANAGDHPVELHSRNSFGEIDHESVGLSPDLKAGRGHSVTWVIISKTDLVMRDDLFDRYFHRTPDRTIGATHLVFFGVTDDSNAEGG